MRILLTGASGFIGTHLMERLLVLYPEAKYLNLDTATPKSENLVPFWTKIDLMDSCSLRAAVEDFAPTHIVHMAARTDPDGTSVADYAVNTTGSMHLMDAIKHLPGIQRTVFFSTQYVVRPGPVAKADDEYRPVNFYGESKRDMEEMIRRAPEDLGVWTIVRPTNVWGPWHPRYAKEFWLIVKKGQYVHPGGAPVMRAYGYVGNVVEYVCRILAAEPELVDRKTFYVGDAIDDVKAWVTAFSLALTGRKPRIVPRVVLRTIGLVGDAVKLTGRSFPLFTSRYRSMTQNYIVDMTPTFTTLGGPLYSLDQGVQNTVEWLSTLGEPWTNLHPASLVAHAEACKHKVISHALSRDSSLNEPAILASRPRS